MNIVDEMRRYMNLLEDFTDDKEFMQDAARFFEPEYMKFLKLLGEFTKSSGARSWSNKINPEDIETFKKFMRPLYAKDDLLLYRGVSIKNWDELDKEWRFWEKQQITANYFLSTSFNEGVASQDYLQSNTGFHDIFLLFKIKPNFYTNGIIIEGHEEELDLMFRIGDDHNWDFSWNPNDEEVILNAGTRFQVEEYGKKECKFKKECEYWEITLKALE